MSSSLRSSSDNLPFEVVCSNISVSEKESWLTLSFLSKYLRIVLRECENVQCFQAGFQMLKIVKLSFVLT